MAKLLVSVRSEVEAHAAIAGGASIIDIKEPSRGSLGMAGCSIWRQVRRVVPDRIPLSVALGELDGWFGPERPDPMPDDWDGIAFRKLGLAASREDWRERWSQLRREMAGDAAFGPAWVAVVYLDWEAAAAPEPESIIDTAAGIGDCRGVLFDTWDKSRRPSVSSRWSSWIGRVKGAGRFVGIAGSLDEAMIRRLRELGPDLFAVRGAACRGGDRDGPVDAGRVASLVEAAGG